jgi:SAM-dependent methyltransferase
MNELTDRWMAGSTYEDFMGRWSRQLASRFVAWLALPEGLDWLDVGCGTGALTRAILERAAPATVVGCDPAAPFIEYARAHLEEDRVSFLVAGAGALPRRASGYGAVASSLALNFMPDPATAVSEMRSLCSTGGTVAASVWDYGGGMEFLRRFWDAAVALDPSAQSLDEGKRFPLCRREPLESLFGAGGLAAVRCVPIDVPTRFAGFDDYWRPLLGGTGPAPSYVASLDPERRSILEAKLRTTLPTGAGGAIELTARAWVARGTAE